MVFEGGNLVVVSSFGDSQADVKDSVVVISGGQIVAAGPRAEVKIPAGAEVVNVAGKYVVPGLIDVFTTLNNQAQANAYLYMGVTSIVGFGDGRRGPLYLDASPSPRIYLHLELPGHENPWKEPIAAILDPKDIHLPANPVTGERDKVDLDGKILDRDRFLSKGPAS